ncbi:MAG TPA: 23S rRNA (pseudouridine(1915)-N(3))-methyltransferase RlmH [Armatimonadota bacterium]|nr:23S rRNA (pseudouridine(1915)-N(3))-methyltransferase RlmH [Armatimonadota bacterium]
MRMTIVAVGKVRERYLRDGIAEYLKRLGRFAAVTIVEVAEDPAPETLSAAEQARVKAREGARLLHAVREGPYVIALDLAGAPLSSAAFAAHLQSLAVGGRADVALLIGGSLGLDAAVLARADLRLSLGPLTYPHQLVRLILLEQLYRAMTINARHPYHK